MPCACADQDDAAYLAVVGDPVLGDYSLDTSGIFDCSATLDADSRAAYQAIAALTRTVVASPAFSECVARRVVVQPYTPCMRGADGGPRGDPYNNRNRHVQLRGILEAARSVNDVHVACRLFSRNTAGRATWFLQSHGAYSAERMRVERSVVREAVDAVRAPLLWVGGFRSVRRLSSLVVHEVMHTHGYRHENKDHAGRDSGRCGGNHDYFGSAPEIVEYCVEHLLTVAHWRCGGVCGDGSTSCFAEGRFRLPGRYQDGYYDERVSANYSELDRVITRAGHAVSGITEPIHCATHVDPAHRSLLALGMDRERTGQRVLFRPLDGVPDGGLLDGRRLAYARSLEELRMLDGRPSPWFVIHDTGGQTLLVRYFERNEPGRPDGGLGVDAVLQRDGDVVSRRQDTPVFRIPETYRLEGVLQRGGDTMRDYTVLLSTDEELIGLRMVALAIGRRRPELVIRHRWADPLPRVDDEPISTMGAIVPSQTLPSPREHRFVGRPRVVTQLNGRLSSQPYLVVQDASGLTLVELVAGAGDGARDLVVNDHIATGEGREVCGLGGTTGFVSTTSGAAPVAEVVATVGSPRFGHNAVWLRGHLAVSRVTGSVAGIGLLRLTLGHRPSSIRGGDIARFLATGAALVGDDVAMQSTNLLARLLARIRSQELVGIAAGHPRGGFVVDRLNVDGERGTVAIFQAGQDLWTYSLPADHVTYDHNGLGVACDTYTRVELNSLVGRDARLNGQPSRLFVPDLVFAYVPMQVLGGMSSIIAGDSVFALATRSVDVDALTDPIANRIAPNRPRGSTFLVEPVRRHVPLSWGSSAATGADLRGPLLVRNGSAPTLCGSSGVCHDGLIDGWLPSHVLSRSPIRARRRDGSDVIILWNHATGRAQRPPLPGAATP